MASLTTHYRYGNLDNLFKWDTPKETTHEEIHKDIKIERMITSLLDIPSSLTYSQTQTGEIPQEGTEVTLKIEDVINKLKMLNVDIPSINEVREYLMVYSDVLELLLPISKTARAYFGDKAQLSLKVYKDPELEDDKYLTLYVRVHKYDDNVIQLIRRIREEFEEELSYTNGWIFITTDFKKPKK